MLARDSTEVSVVAELRVRVPRSAPGDVFAGTRRLVEAVDGVASVESVGITGMTPNLNDLFVEVRVAGTVRLAGPVGNERQAARTTLLDGFGVDRVDSIEIVRPEPDTDT